MQSRRTVAVAALAAVAVGLAAPAFAADTWPSRSLRIIVPNVPGGSSDIIARVVAQPLGTALGVPVIVEKTKSGQLRVIAVSSKARSPLLPNVATIAEQGVPGFESGTYQGVMAPAKMPKENVARLNAELLKIMQSQAVKAKLNELGAGVVTMNPAQTTEFVTKERSRWERVVNESGASIEGQ